MKATSTFNIFGGTNQVLPNATVGIQYIFGNSKDTESGGKYSTPLDKYFKDKQLCVTYIQRIAECTNSTILCKHVLADIYEDVFADTVEGDKTLKSEAFLKDIQPFITFKRGAGIRNLQESIDKYVFGSKIGKKELKNKKTSNR